MSSSCTGREESYVGRVKEHKPHVGDMRYVGWVAQYERPPLVNSLCRPTNVERIHSNPLLVLQHFLKKHCLDGG